MSIPATEGVYLLKWELDPIPVYKVGRSINLAQRLKTYRLHRVLDIFETKDHHAIEKTLISEFNKVYRLTVGNEYFETDADEQKVIDLFRRCTGNPGVQMAENMKTIAEHSAIAEFWISVYKFRDLILDFKTRLQTPDEGLENLNVENNMALEFWRMGAKALETFDYETVSMCELSIFTIESDLAGIISQHSLGIINEIYTHISNLWSTIKKTKDEIVHMNQERLKAWSEVEIIWTEVSKLLEERRILNRTLEDHLHKMQSWRKILEDSKKYRL